MGTHIWHGTCKLLRVASALDTYLQDIIAVEDIEALEDQTGVQGPRAPPLQVSRRPLPIMALGQGEVRFPIRSCRDCYTIFSVH